MDASASPPGGIEGTGRQAGGHGGSVWRKGEGRRLDEVKNEDAGVILTHHKVAAEVVLSPLLVPLAHGLHPLDKLSQDAGLLHPSAPL